MIQYVVDAFAERVFEGNPAAVWSAGTLASRGGDAVHRPGKSPLLETAFAVREGEDWRLRWFTPGGEIDLCGHATLAAAYAILRFADPEAEMIRFHTMSGLLTVRREGELLSMDFPAYSLTRTEVTDAMEDALGIRPREAWLARDLVCVFDDPAAVEKIYSLIWKRSGRWRGLCSMSPLRGRVRDTTAFPAALPLSWRCRRTRCAAPATATWRPTGANGWAKQS